MRLPPDFQFTQANLQDFVDCRRRFLLRHVRRLAWPAIESEPVIENEQLIEKGARFHRMAHQALIGVPFERLALMLDEPELAGWWTNFQSQALPEGRRYPELSLQATLQGYRLVAKVDLLLVTPEGRALIYDWKTSRRRTPRQNMAARLQTRVYPYLLTQAGAQFNAGQPFPPEVVEMIYWYAGFPDEPERFAYDDDRYRADEAYLDDLAGTILSLAEQDFGLTPDVGQCRYCVYRSLCDRGVQAGSLDDWDEAMGAPDDSGGNLDFEQIAEIEF